MPKTNATAATAAKTAKAKAAAKPAIPNPDAIVQSSGNRAHQHFVKAAGGDTLTFPTELWVGPVRDLASIGASFKALKAHIDPLVKKQRTEMARGLKAGDAPQSAKALADTNGRAKATTKADAATQKPKVTKAAKVEARKAERQSWQGDRPYKALVKRADIATRPGTWTEVMIDVALKHATTAKANAELAKHREFGDRKIDWKWLATVRKYIEFTD